MNIYKTSAALILLITLGCKSNTDKKVAKKKQKIEVQGHRGERGHLPENTIEAFLSALHKGVDVIELDVVISKDHNVVVSHEPYMSSVYMSKPTGEPIIKNEEKSFNLYHMDYDSIKTFDSGSRGNKNFPEQQKLKTYKPLLSKVFNTIENEIKVNQLPQIKYNIEIKSEKDAYNIYQPQPEAFVDLIMQVIKENQMENKVNIQSFDPTALNILHKKFPNIEIAYLVSKGSIAGNLKHLNFKPAIYSPNFYLIENKQTVDSLKTLNIKLIPWTVNDQKDIKRMIGLQVDGIITDFPERVMNQLP